MSDVEALPGFEASGAVISKMTAGWNQGLSTYSFTADEMPFASGQFIIEEMNDGTSYPISTKWKSDLGCELTVYYKVDGTFDHCHGVCR